MTDFRRDEAVYVDPHDLTAPREVRGLTGVVKSVHHDRALVVFRSGETLFPMEIDTAVLSRDRRRRNRPPIRWSNDGLPAAG
jgi:hypothetical protein